MDVDLRRFRREIERREQSVPALIRRILERTGEAGRNIMMERAPANRGDLRRSIDYRLEREGRVTIAPRLESPYPLVMLTGSRPIKPPMAKGYPPWTPISRWARRKGLDAGAVYGKIVHYGIDSHEESRDRENYPKKTKEELEKRVPKLAEDSIAKWVKGGIR